MRTKGMLAIVAVMMMLGTGLAGCIGGSGGGGGPASDTETPDGNATNGTETDIPDGVNQADLRPHVHDRWGDQDVVKVVDSRSIDLQIVQQDDPDLQDNCQVSGGQSHGILCYGSETFFPDAKDQSETQIIPPGTGEVRVTLEFDDTRVGSIDFFYQTARSDQESFSHLGEFGPGTSRAIQNLSIRETDGGHAKISKWMFAIQVHDAWWPAPGEPPNPMPAVWQAPHPQGLTVTVTVEAHRVEGELPIEPPHPVYWQGTDFYRVAHTYGNVDSAGPAPGFVHAGRAAVQPNGRRTEDQANLRGEGITWRAKPGHTLNYTQIGTSDFQNNLPQPFAEDAVPPQTEKIVTKVRINGQSNAGVDVCLYGRFSTQQPKFGQQIDCFTHSGSGVVNEVLEMQVKGNMLDSPYAGNVDQNNISRWTWTLQISGQGDDETRSVGDWTGTIEVAVFATKNLDFEPPSWAFQL